MYLFKEIVVSHYNRKRLKRKKVCPKPNTEKHEERHKFSKWPLRQVKRILRFAKAFFVNRFFSVILKSPTNLVRFIMANKYSLADDGILNVELKRVKSVHDSATNYCVVRDAEKTAVYIPSSVGNEENRSIVCFFPELYIAEISHVRIVGETNIIADDEAVISDFCDEVASRVDISHGDLLCCYDDKVVLAYREISKRIDKAINLIQAGNYNYYHFFIETLSKLVLVDEVEKYRDFPILVDSIVRDNNNLFELLRKCNVFNHEIIWLNKNEHCIVDNLILPAGAVKMPGNLIKREYLREDDFKISPWLLKKLQSRCRYDVDNPELFRKIVISRKDVSNSRLNNEKDVIDFWEQRGLDVIYPEKMSIQEQANLFATSDVIVATSGAAMANMMFCHPATQIYCIIPREHNFYLYSTMAYILGLEYKNIDATIVKESFYQGADEFRVDLDYLSNCFRM